MKSVLCIVSGRVQGVWYRGSAQEQARKLGVTGHARNLSDGTVEVLACGDDAAVDALIAWLHKGPMLARVRSVQVTPCDAPSPSDFSVA